MFEKNFMDKIFRKLNEGRLDKRKSSFRDIVLKTAP